MGPPPPSLTSVEPKCQRDEHNKAAANAFRHLIGILWVCCLSPACHNVVRPLLTSALDGSPLHLVCLPVGQPHMRNLWHESLQPTSHTFHQTQHLLRTHQASFLALHLRLYLSGNDTDWGAKIVPMFMHLQWEEGHTHIQQLSWGFSSHGDMTAVMILSKKQFQMTLKAGMRDQHQVTCWGWRRGGAVVGAKLTFWTTPFKASFNHHHSLERLYNMFSALMALDLALTGKGWGQSSAVETFSNRLLRNLQNEPLLELQSNLTWMMLKMLRTKTWERNLHPWMHTLETEA